MLLRGKIRSLTPVSPTKSVPSFMALPSLPETSGPSLLKLHFLAPKGGSILFPFLVISFSGTLLAPHPPVWISSPSLGRPNLSLHLCSKSYFQTFPGSVILP